jgi:hypothetical protein
MHLNFFLSTCIKIWTHMYTPNPIDIINDMSWWYRLTFLESKCVLIWKIKKKKKKKGFDLFEKKKKKVYLL